LRLLQCSIAALSVVRSGERHDIPINKDRTDRRSTDPDTRKPEMTQIALHMPVFATLASDVARRVFITVGNFFESISAAGRVGAEIERLGRLTNSELAAQGLNRETALRDVFERNFR